MNQFEGYRPDSDRDPRFLSDGPEELMPVGDNDLRTPAEYDAAVLGSEIAGTQQANDRLLARRAAGKEMFGKIYRKLFGPRR